MTGKDDVQKARILVDLLAKDLSEHLSIVESILQLTRKAKLAVPSSRSAASELQEQTENLRALRDAIRVKAEALLDLIENVNLPLDVIEDIYALSGYYVEAASKGEKEALSSAAWLDSLEEDLVMLERTRNIVLLLYGAASRKYKYLKAK